MTINNSFSAFSRTARNVFNTSFQKLLDRVILAICTLTITLSPLSFADGTSLGSTDSFDASSNQDEFLRVEDAYQVMTEITDNKVELTWSLAPGYYLYQHQFKLEANNGTSSEKLELTFEPGKRKFDEYFNKELEVYYYNTYMHANAPQIQPPFELKVTSQGCADAGLCYPPRKQYFQVASNGVITASDASQLATPSPVATNNNDSNTDISSNENAANTPFLPGILFAALLGGLILNLMPCVFPVLSLKALSFASGSHSQQKQHHHGWAYTAGVVISFVLAAAVILAAKSAGTMLGWGFQLQQPLFVAVLVYLFLIMGLSLSGAFHFGSQLMGVGQSLTAGAGLRASFFTGVLAAVVASPCTAPFMATALGVALTQPIGIALLTFAMLGLGMALPFLVLSYSPTMVNYLPKPGAWMETLKQFLAFPLYATCIWLLWVLAHQTSSDGAAIILFGALLITFALWLLQLNSDGKTIGKWLVRLLALASIAAAVSLTLKIDQFVGSSMTSNQNTPWQTYSDSALTDLRNQGEPVFVNLTADWCITCKVNERVAFSSDAFFNTAEEFGVTLMKGDYTNDNPEITQLLKTYKRSGVPLYLVFPAEANSAPEILPQILSPALIRAALARTAN